jgi:hypothetical protein
LGGVGVWASAALPESKRTTNAVVAAFMGMLLGSLASRLAQNAVMGAPPARLRRQPITAMALGPSEPAQHVGHVKSSVLRAINAMGEVGAVFHDGSPILVTQSRSGAPIPRIVGGQVMMRADLRRRTSSCLSRHGWRLFPTRCARLLSPSGPINRRAFPRLTGC